VGAWVNRAGALDQVAVYQFDRGDIAAAIASERRGLALADDPRAPRRLGPAIAYYWQHLSNFQARAGDRAGAEQSMQAFLRANRANLAKLPATSPQRRINEAGEKLMQLGEIDLYAGTPQQALAQATAGLAKVEAIKVPAADAIATANQKNIVWVFRSTAADAAVQARHYPQAEKLARQMLAAPSASTAGNQQADKAHTHTILAEAVAMQGRYGDARKILQPVLDYYTGQFKAGAGTTRFRVDYARARYVSAISRPTDAAGNKQRRTDLAIATKVLAGASAEARRKVTALRRISALIAAARYTPARAAQARAAAK
jgi:hypothetical protein